MIKRFTIKRMRSKRMRSKRMRSKRMRSKRIRSKKSKKSKSIKNKTQKGGHRALRFLQQVRLASPAVKEMCKNNLKEFTYELYLDRALNSRSTLADYLKKFAKENIKNWIEKNFKDMADIKFIESKEPIKIYDNNKHFKDLQEKFHITKEDYNKKITKTIHDLLQDECIDINPYLINVEDDSSVDLFTPEELNKMANTFDSNDYVEPPTEPEPDKVSALSDEELSALMRGHSERKKSQQRRSSRSSSRSSSRLNEVDG